MKTKKSFKCRNCNERQPREPRSKNRQRYCSQPECRRASKAESQRQWLDRPENQDYFRGADNSERVRRWRIANPDRRKKGPSKPLPALQDAIDTQVTHNQYVTKDFGANALQEMCATQPAVFVGLISFLTGHTLQDDCITCARKMIERGFDIMRGGNIQESNDNHRKSLI